MMLEDRARIVSYIRRKTHNQEEAEDIVQDAFMVAFKKIDTFQGKCQLRSWVTRIAINFFLMRLRKYDATHTVWGYDLSYNPAPGNLEVETVNKLDYAKLQGMIDQLPACYARTLTMRGQGMMYKEIAQTMGWSVGTAKSYVNRGKARLLREVHQPQ